MHFAESSCAARYLSNFGYHNGATVLRQHVHERIKRQKLLFNPFTFIRTNLRSLGISDMLAFDSNGICTVQHYVVY